MSMPLGNARAVIFINIVDLTTLTGTVTSIQESTINEFNPSNCPQTIRLMALRNMYPTSVG